jgi:hypothetical protein
MDPMEGRLFLLSILAWVDGAQLLIKLKTKESTFRVMKAGFRMMRNGITTLLSANAVGFLRRLKRFGPGFTKFILFWK